MKLFTNNTLSQIKSLIKPSPGSFIKNIQTTFLTKIIIAACNAIITVLTAGLLGPEGRGTYATAIAYCNIATYIGLLGLNIANTCWITRQKENIKSFISNNFIFSITMGTFICFMQITTIIFFPELAVIRDPILLIMSSIWVLLGLYISLSQGIQLGLENIKYLNIVEMTTPIITIIGILFLFISKSITANSFFFCAILGQIISFSLSIYFLRPYTANFLNGWSLKLLSKNLSYGIHTLYFPSILLFMLLSLDLLIVKSILGEKEAGYYSIATAIANLLLLFPSVVSTLLFAKISAENTFQSSWRYCIKVIQLLSTIMLGELLITYFAINSLIKIIFGIAYIPAIFALKGLLPAVFFNSLSNIYFTFNASIGQGRMNTIPVVTALILNLLFNFTLIPKLGIIGASLAASASYAILFILLMFRQASYKKKLAS